MWGRTAFAHNCENIRIDNGVNAFTPLSKLKETEQRRKKKEEMTLSKYLSLIVVMGFVCRSSLENSTRCHPGQRPGNQTKKQINSPLHREGCEATGVQWTPRNRGVFHTSKQVQVAKTKSPYRFLPVLHHRHCEEPRDEAISSSSATVIASGAKQSHVPLQPTHKLITKNKKSRGSLTRSFRPKRRNPSRKETKK